MLKFFSKLFVPFSLYFLIIPDIYSTTTTTSGSFKLPYKRHRLNRKNGPFQAITMNKIKNLFQQKYKFLTKRMTKEYETPLIDSYNTIFTATVTIGGHPRARIQCSHRYGFNIFLGS
ncbi:unnamed protein product [Meloidogyne enterolobii]|uniref:Uncharacterized protein n=1 Tax=Meloidogyne enterolobii TaxID=390850 RepID=A0ACB0YIG2_MELEN